eukprot:CAMPEP_0206147926 /NCGR_PEP_ID=MMETSP1473-20131121/35026_1 /ASSEMBLY_ACC=CAM_ASM_001109 /TAXON_ID=1461547 /ORGANISM="Stichococcus sp, Strain RCC1054" /LENGTH=71 /DNA_ID=CAMNT_0053545075 /DNA_START=224 /DNA_END=439 /DNA_ORIENTATION=-
MAKGGVDFGIAFRAAAAGALAIGSKAAMIMKSGGGVGSLAKVGGLLAAGGTAAVAAKSTQRPDTATAATHA